MSSPIDRDLLLETQANLRRADRVVAELVDLGADAAVTEQQGLAPSVLQQTHERLAALLDEIRRMRAAFEQNTAHHLSVNEEHLRVSSTTEVAALDMLDSMSSALTYASRVLREVELKLSVVAGLVNSSAEETLAPEVFLSPAVGR